MPPPFSDTVMEHFFDPKNVGQLPEPCGKGEAGSPQRGVFMRIFVQLADGVVNQTAYLTYGCVPAIAAGSLLTEWARGRSVDDVLDYTATRLRSALGGLPADRRFCADMAVDALKSAVRNALAASSEEGAPSS